MGVSLLYRGIFMGLPFLYLGMGILLGLSKIEWLQELFNKLLYVALIVVMLVIGANIGIDKILLQNIGWIGMKAVGLALGTILFSVLYCVLLEKTIVPLEKMEQSLNSTEDIKETEEKKTGLSLFTLGIPFYVLAGAGIGYYLLPSGYNSVLNYLMNGSLILVYVGIGMVIGSDLSVFKTLRLLGWRVVLFTVAIILGSLTSALVVTPLLGIPWSTGIISSLGMSYFTLTGAFMTQHFGTEAGVYGFLVNVTRDFITVLFLPFLIRIGKSAPIAGAAAGSMDILLLPVTQAIGSRLGLVAFITGTMIVVIVPFLLPILLTIFKIYSLK